MLNKKEYNARKAESLRNKNKYLRSLGMGECKIWLKPWQKKEMSDIVNNDGGHYYPIFSVRDYQLTAGRVKTRKRYIAVKRDCTEAITCNKTNDPKDWVLVDRRLISEDPKTLTIEKGVLVKR